MRYLTYDKYVEYRGTAMDAPTFTGYAFQAESTIDYYTFNRLTYVPLEEQPEKTQIAVKFCMMELIRLLALKDSYDGIYPDGENSQTNAQIESQENDGVMVTYNVMAAAQSSENIKKKITQTLNHYLSGCLNNLDQKVLYTGIYPNE